MAAQYDRNATQPPVVFDEHMQRVLVWFIYDACKNRQWRLHYIVANPSHVHALVSWRELTPWKTVSDKLKNLSSL